MYSQPLNTKTPARRDPIDDINKLAKDYEALTIAREQLGEKILECLRFIARLTSQTTIARNLDITPQYLSDVLTGKRAMNRAFNQRILASFIDPADRV